MVQSYYPLRMEDLFLIKLIKHNVRKDIIMSKVVEKKSKDGTLNFRAEYVDGELPPITDTSDGKTIYLRDLPFDRLLNMARVSGCAWSAAPIAKIAQKFGDEAWDVAAEAMREFALNRSRQTLKRANIDINDARTLGRFMDFEDNIFGIEGEYVEYTKKKAVRRQFHCPWADMIVANNAVPLCTKMMTGYMEGVRDAMKEAGAKLKDLGHIPMLTTGDPYCELVWELED